MQANAVFHKRPIAALYELLTGQSFWRRAIDDMLLWAAPTLQAQRVLDLGCGPGESTFALARALPSAEIIGIDFAAVMIERAERRLAAHPPSFANIRFAQVDAANMPFPEHGFDLAIGHSFLYLVQDPAGVLRETRRVLRPGGALVLMEPSSTGSLVGALRQGRRKILPALRQAPVAALRFAASMVLWRLWSRSAGTFSAERLSDLLSKADFDRVTVQAALGGLGLHCRAQTKADRERSSSPATTGQRAAR